MRYLDDLTPGDRFTGGPVTVTEEDIVAFARQFDPQPFHLDPEAAQDSVFGGLAASGWHTAGLTMRMIVTGDGAFSHTTAPTNKEGVTRGCSALSH
ncbi:MaoC/PaaZ C-terminal domain-containing protein, partial [Azospirillum brasilense]|uniref:MaoC/PaaZ C-terminal domain-containing protein n=1 Tax=Azospirillum brasilense TaxID=192 RepID=UPI002493E3EB